MEDSNMKDIYTWLFERYALRRLKPLETEQQKIAAAFAGRLSLNQKNHLRFIDFTDNMRLQWGVEAFALGIRFGMRLNAPRAGVRDASSLLSFLPQLDDPVS